MKKLMAMENYFLRAEHLFDLLYYPGIIKSTRHKNLIKNAFIYFSYKKYFKTLSFHFHTEQHDTNQQRK